MTITPKEAMTVGIKYRPDDPALLARRFAAQDGRPLLHHRGRWYRYAGTHYAADSTLRSRVAQFMDRHFADLNVMARSADKKDKEGAGSKIPVTGSRLRDTVVRLEDHHVIADEVAPPCWLDGAEQDVIALRNGLLDPIAQSLHTHTARYYSHSVTTYDFDPAATCPMWDEFMRSIWPDDPASIDTLAEFAGLILTKITRFQKLLLIQGPPRSGKGTIVDVLTRLIGQDQVVAKGLTTLGAQFGLANLTGKLLCVIPEARVNWRTDLLQAITRLISISGEDRIDVDVKNRDEVNTKSYARFLITSNSPLDLGDSSDAMASRLLVLQQRVSFRGKEDTTLRDRLATELPGVLNWALLGLARLLQRGRFEQPESGKTVLQAFRAVNDRVGAFIKDELVIDPKATVEKKRLYDNYQRWCHDNGRKALSHQHFATELYATGSVDETRKRLPGGKREQHYTGVRERTEKDDRDPAEEGVVEQ